MNLRLTKHKKVVQIEQITHVLGLCEHNMRNNP